LVFHNGRSLFLKELEMHALTRGVVATCTLLLLSIPPGAADAQANAALASAVDRRIETILPEALAGANILDIRKADAGERIANGFSLGVQDLAARIDRHSCLQTVTSSQG
jgi:hypothetical protein